MKTCPVCQAVAFDDAELCYGCLHRFVEEMPRLAAEEDGGAGQYEAVEKITVIEEAAADELSAVLEEPAAIEKRGVTEACKAIEGKKNTPPAFSIRFTPEAGKAGDVVWTCAVEVA